MRDHRTESRGREEEQEGEDEGFDPDVIVLPGVGLRRVAGLPEELETLWGVFVQASRTSTRDVTLSPLVGEVSGEAKSECKHEEHRGERFLVVSNFSPDPSRPNGRDRYCKFCRSRLAASRRSRKRRSTSALPQPS